MNPSGENEKRPPIVYGELSILGYNGYIPNVERNGRRNRSKYLLCKRPAPNGIKKSRHYIVKQPSATKAIQDKELHSISYTFSRTQTIIVEYCQDEDTDMFQIGRSTEEPIDFVVMDTPTFHLTTNGANCVGSVVSGGGSSSSSRHHHHHHHQHHHHLHQVSPNDNTTASSHNNQQQQDLVGINQRLHLHQMVKQVATGGGGVGGGGGDGIGVGGAGGGPGGDQPPHAHAQHQHHHHHHHHPHHHLQQQQQQQHQPQGVVGSHHPPRPIPLAHIQPFAPRHHSRPHHAAQSTISRFACRILVDREPPYTARIYAAGFDSSKNIFLGEKATKWEQNNSIDGLTTNGVLLLHSKQSQFLEKSTDSTTTNVTNNNDDAEQQRPTTTTGVWREVSVDGGIYAIRETRSAAQKGVKIEDEDNILQDGTLIDLCGATLLWRSVEGFKAEPSKKYLEEKVDELNASRPQCPVGLNTLVIPRKPLPPPNPLHIHHQYPNPPHHHSHHHNYSTGQILNGFKDNHSGSSKDSDKSGGGHQPYVYLKCGHVQGYHDWGATEKSNHRTCPICLSVGQVSKLSMGLEPSFYVDSSGPLTHVFNPCGHMATERTIKYWSTVKIPFGTHFFHSICPFCATPLSTTDPAAVRLIFQDDLD